ncbi:LysR family transcriptional regulator [Actinoallomurus sp. CA-150999]|uniref:LysR family transcriptional regulator n=1 Tax=Actinoallomurus sp. CA-150999 TaxID=3239887 RepID=UPI003D9323E2
MDIRSLRYAITLAEELHFGRAAQRHYIGAQAFGRRIQNLERELGVRLFERTSRRVTVTPVGAQVVAEARAIVEAMDALTDARRWAESDEEGPTTEVLGSVVDKAPELTELTAIVPHGFPGLTFVGEDANERRAKRTFRRIPQPGRRRADWRRSPLGMPETGPAQAARILDHPATD